MSLSYKEYKEKFALEDIQKRSILERMVLTRCVDNSLKKLFMTGEIDFGGKPFQGKGFRSLGQEAIVAAGEVLKKGAEADVIAPMIRDLGMVLAFTGDDIVSALNAQVGKDLRPLFGKDLHHGAYHLGIMPAAAPLALSTSALIGSAWAMKIKKQDRVAVALNGEGATSLGEWHEAINLAAVHSLPMIFCIQDNTTALSTRRVEQCAARKFSDKALGYGMRGITIDGNDPDAIAAAFAWGRSAAVSGNGPVMIELITMRMCGHAHHDDMLYLGREPKVSFSYPKLEPGGYADKTKYETFLSKDPIINYANKLVREKICADSDLDSMIDNAETKIAAAIEVIKNSKWPKPGERTFQIFRKIIKSQANSFEPENFSKGGITYLDAIGQAIEDSMHNDAKVLVIGEDVAAPYGNAFMAFRGKMEGLEDRFKNTPISENAIVGACAGLALEGLRPLGEMQFNDFSASAFNPIVNYVAKLFFRTGLNLPLVLRMPWGGLRSAGPYHSQDTSPWFYRATGLKIVSPSSPQDAYSLLMESINDPDPVLFYEHIALYRDPSIRQEVDKEKSVSIGSAKIAHTGEDLTIVCYGAYVHRVTNLVKNKDFSAEVVDLRSLQPIDWATIEKSLKKTSKVLLVGEDQVCGSILESLASQISGKYFTWLDAPPKVLGSKNTPVPYAPSLEAAYLVSMEEIEEAIAQIISW